MWLESLPNVLAMATRAFLCHFWNSGDPRCKISKSDTASSAFRRRSTAFVFVGRAIIPTPRSLGIGPEPGPRGTVLQPAAPGISTGPPSLSVIGVPRIRHDIFRAPAPPKRGGTIYSVGALIRARSQSRSGRQDNENARCLLPPPPPPSHPRRRQRARHRRQRRRPRVPTLQPRPPVRQSNAGRRRSTSSAQ